MEVRSLSEQVQWEARRVAEAFGVQEWERRPEHRMSHAFEGQVGFLQLRWRIERTQWSTLSLHSPNGQHGLRAMCWLSQNPTSRQWIVTIRERQQSIELLTRGLYRLGFEDEGVLRQLPALSAHEKLELRLSMPREFWPKGWLGEEDK